MDQFGYLAEITIWKYNRHQINIYTGDIHATICLHKRFYLAVMKIS